ncbi:MAG: alpha/beta fold hydrolase [Patescibacteria group bacterium]
MEKVTFTTQDGVKLVGNYFSPAAPATTGVLCLHMMPETKESWTKLAELLAAQGRQVLAIDERGHGESVWRDDQKLNYQQFSDAEQQAKRLDVEAALQWMQSQGVQLSQCLVIGASIGANLALDVLVRFSQLPAAVLLSPGQDYRGVQTDTAITQLKPDQHVLLVASRDDEYSFESVERLDQLSKTPHETWRLERAGHGTHMFAAEPDLMQKVVRWITQATASR